jgi:hypothetical protein
MTEPNSNSRTAFDLLDALDADLTSDATAPRARSAASSRASAIVARLGRKIAAYPILATAVAFGAGFAFIRWIRR